MTTDFTLPTGLPLGTYSLCVVADGIASSPVAFTVSPQSPTGPALSTGLTATAGNAQVALAWTASSGATSYDIYRGSTSGGETLLASGVTTASYTDTGLSNGTTYYYEVTAVNAAGQSGRSDQIVAAPHLNPPLAPPAWSPPRAMPR